MDKQIWGSFKIYQPNKTEKVWTVIWRYDDHLYKNAKWKTMKREAKYVAINIEIFIKVVNVAEKNVVITFMSFSNADVHCLQWLSCFFHLLLSHIPRTNSKCSVYDFETYLIWASSSFFLGIQLSKFYSSRVRRLFMFIKLWCEKPKHTVSDFLLEKPNNIAQAFLLFAVLYSIRLKLQLKTSLYFSDLYSWDNFL